MSCNKNENFPLSRMQKSVDFPTFSNVCNVVVLLCQIFLVFVICLFLLHQDQKCLSQAVGLSDLFSGPVLIFVPANSCGFKTGSACRLGSCEIIYFFWNRFSLSSLDHCSSPMKYIIAWNVPTKLQVPKSVSFVFCGDTSRQHSQMRLTLLTFGAQHNMLGIVCLLDAHIFAHHFLRCSHSMNVNSTQWKCHTRLLWVML